MAITARPRLDRRIDSLGARERVSLAGIHAADANLPDPAGIDRTRGATEFGQLLWAVTAQARHRHAVQIAARCQHGGVEVGVGIEPQHAQALAVLPAMP